MTLFEKVKANLVLEHSQDNALLNNFISAAINYAESFQHIPFGTYTGNEIPPLTELAVIMLALYFFKSRNGSTVGFFSDSDQVGQQVWDMVNLLLQLDRY